MTVLRLAGRVAFLVVLWLLAWGDISLANVVSGIAVSAVLLVAFPVREQSRSRVRLHPYGVVRLFGYVLVQLVISNVVMAREILRRRVASDQGVIRHHVEQPSEEVVAVMTTIISLSPGTMTVDVDMDTSTIAVHFFRLRDPAAAHAEIERLERLVGRSITTRAPRSPEPALATSGPGGAARPAHSTHRSDRSSKEHP